MSRLLFLTGHTVVVRMHEISVGPAVATPILARWALAFLLRLFFEVRDFFLEGCNDVLELCLLGRIGSMGGGKGGQFFLPGGTGGDQAVGRFQNGNAFVVELLIK